MLPCRRCRRPGSWRVSSATGSCVRSARRTSRLVRSRAARTRSASRLRLRCSSARSHAGVVHASSMSVASSGSMRSGAWRPSSALRNGLTGCGLGMARVVRRFVRIRDARLEVGRQPDDAVDVPAQEVLGGQLVGPAYREEVRRRRPSPSTSWLTRETRARSPQTPPKSPHSGCSRVGGRGRSRCSPRRSAVRPRCRRRRRSRGRCRRALRGCRPPGRGASRRGQSSWRTALGPLRATSRAVRARGASVIVSESLWGLARSVRTAEGGRFSVRPTISVSCRMRIR